MHGGCGGDLSIALVCLCLSACVERASEWTNNFDSLHSPSRVLGQNLQQALLFQKTLFCCCSSASHFSSSFTHSHFHSLFLFFSPSSFLRFSESFFSFYSHWDGRQKLLLGCCLRHSMCTHHHIQRPADGSRAFSAKRRRKRRRDLERRR